MRIRSSTWGMPAILMLMCAGLGHAALPTGAATDSNTTTTATKPAAKPTASGTKTVSATAKKSSAAPGHSTASRKAVHPAVVARGQMAPTASRVSEIQAALAKDGAYQGDPNGRWDAPTVDAMRHFLAMLVKRGQRFAALKVSCAVDIDNGASLAAARAMLARESE